MNVPKLRFPEFSGKWEDLKVDDLFTHVRNGFVGTATPYYVKNGVPYLQSNNIRRNRIDKRKLVYVNNEFHEKNKKSVLEKDDILMVQSGHAGECAVVPEELKGANCHALIVMSPTNQINSHFCAYYINSSIGKSQIHKLITGNTIQHILASELKKFRIILPEISEQEKIASFLSKVDEKIEKLDKKEELWQIYKKGMMQQLFSQKLRFKDENGNDYPDWEEKKLGDISKIQRGASPRPINSKKWYDNTNKTVGWVRISDVTKSNKFLYKTEDYFSQEGIKKSRFLSKGSLIMSICATIGKPIITEIDTCIHDGFIGFSNLKGINKEFLYYTLNILETKFCSLGQTGSQSNLNSDLVRITKIKIPSISEQTKIVNLISSIDKKTELINKELEINKEFKKGLLQKMFPSDKKSGDTNKDFSKLDDKQSKQTALI